MPRLHNICAAIAVISLAAAGLLAAQDHPFVYSLVPGRDSARPGSVVFGDVAYGQNMFAGLGPEHLEQRVAAQLGLSRRITLIVQGGWVLSDEAVASRVTGQAEVLVGLLPPGSRTILAIGGGGMRDYQGAGVALGRVVAGYRWQRTFLVANLRLERPFPSTTPGSPAAPRDAIDVVTTLGLARQVSPGLRFGLESVAEDLEGLFESEEAEGGAKLMMGPSVGIGAPTARWGLTVAGGPVLRLSNSTVPGSGSGAARDLSGGGFVVRSSVRYRW